jgi:hypothetical protein
MKKGVAPSMPQNAGPVRPTASTRLKPHHVRSFALAGAVVGVVVLPIAAAQATPSQNNDSQSGGTAQSAAAGQPSADAQSPSPVAQAVASEFCGTATTESRPGGTIRAQACVDQSGGTALARLYAANTTGTAQVAALNLTRADGGVVQVQCVVAAGDTSAQCATSPVPVGTGSGAFDAIAELVGQNAPVSAGLIHIESGLVAPAGQ